MKMNIRLLVVGILCLLFAGCAAGQVYISQSEGHQSSCLALDNELELAQNKIQTLETIDHTAKNIRDFSLGALRFVFPPIGFLNALLIVSDSHIADLAETKALQGRHDDLVNLSNQNDCGYQYAQRNARLNEQ